MNCCSLCGRLLDVDVDPLSGDCGGHCWSCIGLIEAEQLKDGMSIEFVAKEIAWEWRDRTGTGKPQSVFLADPELCKRGDRLH